MASVVYPAATGDFGDYATVVVNGNHVRVTDANIDAVVGAGLSYKFTASFDIALGGSAGTMHFNKNQTYVLSAMLKTALLAASAPMTSV